MLAPYCSSLDSESEVTSESSGGGGEEAFGGDLDISGTLFATLLTDVSNSDNIEVCSETVSARSSSDMDDDDFFEYLSNRSPKDKVKETRPDMTTCDPVRKTKSCSKVDVPHNSRQDVVKNPKTAYSRPPLMCSTNVNMKSATVELKRIDATVSDRKSERCMSRNAILARENREKKKHYINQLETTVEVMKVENYDLKSKLDAKSKLCDSLHKENEYLRNVLANQSCIGALLKNIHATHGVAFTSSLVSQMNPADTDFKKRPRDENENYKNTSKGIYVRATGSHKRTRNESEKDQEDSYSSPLTPCPSPDQLDGSSSGGVCLHVSDNKVSLEICSQCAENAGNAWRIAGDHTYFKS